MTITGELELLTPVSGVFGRWPITAGSFVLGRSADSDWVLAAAVVSRQQFRLHCRPDGCWIENLSRTNPTYVQGSPLAGPRRLQDGDILGIGRLRLQYRSAPIPTSANYGRVRVQQLGRPNRLVHLSSPDVWIGRNPACDLTLDFPAISHRHLRLIWQQEEGYRLYDVRKDPEVMPVLLEDRPMRPAQLWPLDAEIWLGDALGNGVSLFYVQPGEVAEEERHE